MMRVLHGNKNEIKRKISALFFFLLLHLGVFAQTADFSINLSNKCGNGTATFEDKSGIAVTKWEWNFGNSNSTVIEAPDDGSTVTAIYPKPGVYTVSLTVNDGDPTVKEVTIYPNPEPNFTVSDAVGCEPMDILLTGFGENVDVAPFTIDGTSVGGVPGGAIVNYQWDFQGKIDGITSADPALSLSALQANDYGVLLILTDENGCEGTKFEPTVFQVNPTPTGDFNFTKENSCGVGNVTFDALATISSGQISEYQWDIDNDDIIEAVSQSYTHSFSTAGTFDVALTLKSDQGCLSTEVIKQVQFNDANTSDFSFTGNCAGQSISFTDESSASAIAWSWDFNGDSIEDSDQQNPTTSFANAGDKSVTLRVTHSDGCVMEVTKTIPVSGANASFTYDFSALCAPEYEVVFNNTSTASTGTITSYSWDFNGDDTEDSNVENPTYSFNASGTYTVKLTVISSEGCESTYSEDVTINEKTLDFSITSPAEGCEGLAVSFEGSYSDVVNDPVVSWNWTFENGSEAGTGQNTSYTYNTRGEYDVTLSIVTTNGCSLSTTKPEAVQVGQKPVISNITKPVSSCANDPVVFTASFTGLADSLYWQFSDGGDETSGFTDGNSPQSVSYNFTDDSDNHVLNLIAYDNGCPSDPYELTDIVVNQPVARFSASKTVLCSIPETVTFTNNSDSDAAGTTYEWDFDGDGIVDSTDENPSHSYTAAGDYTVKLIVFNPDTGCTDENTKKIYVTTSTPDFITDKTVDCHPAEIEFTNQIAGNSSANFSIDKVEWDFNNDGTIDSSEENPTYTYTSPNSYGITMTVTEENGCVYSVEKDGWLSVNGPVASFTKSPDEACLGDEITFTNTTSKFIRDPANQDNYSYSWNFGDGSTSTDKDPTHTYISKEVFAVSLTVTDENTCSNTFTESNSVIVPNLLAGFTTSRDIYCLGANVEFTNTASITNGSASITLYEWDLDGDGIYEISTASNANQSFTFTSADTFTVKQRITSSLGCTDEFSKVITIVDGNGSFTPDEINLGCAPASTTFRANDNDAVVESYTWNFGDGETSDKREPMHFYVNPGSYEVELTVVLTGGCSKTSKQTIFVAGPVGDFSYNNIEDCAAPNHEVTFAASNMQDVTSLVWDFGNGFTENENVSLGTTDKTKEYSYTSKGTKLPILILTDDGTCGSYSYIREDLGRINTSTPPTVDFSKSSGDNICENVEFQFSDLSVLTDDRYQIVTWSWDFDEDGIEDSSEKNPTFTYTTAETYDVSLTVTTSFGCTASLTKTDFITVVSPSNLKDLAIDITEPFVKNSKFCSTDNVTFNGSATSTNGDGTISAWEWDFGDGNEASIQNAPHSYSTADEGLTKTVTLTVTDNSQCVQVITKDVSIYKVEADFSITSTPVLRGNNIAFADLSTTEINAATDGTISAWAWTFEEGTPTSSGFQNPSIAYNTIGSDYDVDLTVTNNEGCTASTTKKVSVSNNPPLVTSFGVSGNEDNDIVIAQANFNSNFDTSLDPSQTLTKVKITSLPDNGDLYIGATKISAIGTELTYAQLANLKFVPDENWNGSTSFDYNAYDGYDYAADDATITITVNQVQDVPVVTDIADSNNKDKNTTFDIATFEDKFSDVDLVGNDNPDFQKIKITVLPTAAMGVLKLNGVAIAAIKEINKSDITNLVFEPTAGFVGDAIFSWNGSDGADYAAADAQVSINYFNTKAELTDENLGNSIKEDVVVNITQSDFIDNHSDTDVNDDPFDYIKVISLPSSGGVFSIGGSALSVGQEITYAQLATDVIFTPTNGYNGTITLEWDAFDGTELSTGPAKFTFTYINTPPTVSNITKATVDEDTQVDFTAADFTDQFADVDASDVLTKIRLRSLPTNGTLKLSGVAVSNGDYIDVDDLAKLQYFPNPDFNGTDSFIWKGNDGTDNSSNTATVNLTINPVQDKPTVSDISKSVVEDADVQITKDDFIANFTDVDSPYGNPNSELSEITITSLPSNGTLEYNGSAIVIGTNNVIAVADIDTGSGIVFIPDSGYEGDSSFGWNGSDGLNYADAEATVTITHNNTPPVVTNEDFGDKLEDLVFTITRADFDDNYSDANATDTQFEKVNIISLPDVSIGKFTLDGADLNTGEYTYAALVSGLVFTPLAGENGTVNLVWNAEDGTDYAVSNATFSFTYINSVPTVSDFSKPAVDEDNNVVFAQADFDSNYSDVDANDSMEKIKITDLPDNGTLKYGATTVSLDDEIAYADLANLIFQPNENWFGSDSFKWTGYDGTVYSSESTVSLTVNSVNDIPTAADGSVTELEDQTYTFASTDFSNSYSDVETAFAGIKIISLETEGYLKVGSSDVSLNQILDLNDIADLTFSTDANENGTAYATFGFAVFDGEDYSTEVYTMTVNITPVNDEPSFSLKTDPNVTVDEDSGFKILNGQAISINKGAANESDQNLSFVLTNDNNSLFSSQPAMDAGGNLNFTLADDAFGTATVTVILKDDGGTANGGDDTSDSQTFVITVNSVNDIPIAADESVTELEDQTYTFASADFSNSYADVETAFAGIEITGLENVGNLEYDGIPVTTGLQIASVDISKLKFIPNADENGNAYDSFTFKVYDGEAYSADAYTMTLNYTPVNDEPSFTLNSPKDIEVDEDNGTETVVGQVVTQSEGPADESSQDLTLHVSHTNSGLFSVDPAINAAGTLTFTPTPNAFGISTVTVYITDDGGTDDGGDDTSDSQTFVITVNSVNDAPVADNDSGTVDEGQSVTISLIDGDSDVDGTLDVTTITIVSGPVNGSIVDNGDGTITYTHDGSETASDSFTYTIQDNDAAESNVASVSIAVIEVNDPPVALDNNAITKEDTPVVILVLANDSDVDGTLDLTSLQVVSGPSNGTVSINPTTG
ncbi:PKD domain-containing protein, partial [Marinifilum sp. RC60d5]|uniref:PKD domain-containing protein n=1 Tax=Marinifilum sp. RC60d5 TaxID=3458414 RepID=UPI00403690FC